MRRLRRLLWIVFFCLILPLLVADAMLWHLDLSGIVTMRQDSNRLTDLSTGSVDGWRMIPGQHRFRRYTAIVGLDGFRSVPETQMTDCKIYVLGDSVVYGMGSNTTFVNLLAADLPDVTLLNRGIGGYGASNIRALMAYEPPADGYIWLIYENDVEPLRRFSPNPPPLQPASIEYIRHWQVQSEPRQLDPIEGFTVPADEILARPDVLAFALEGRYLTDVIQERYPQVVIIPDYTDFSSAVDNHPGEIGHRQIADAMRPAVMAFVAERCAA